jgi:MFS transporter, DHA1 family, inner membrane transport protein
LCFHLPVGVKGSKEDPFGVSPTRGKGAPGGKDILHQLDEAGDGPMSDLKWDRRGMAVPVGIATLCRLFLNTARRFPYPFAPVLGRGLDVPLTAITTIIAAGQATGVIGVFLGPLGDRFGYRPMMLAGLAMLVLGMFAAGFLPFYGIVLAGIFIAGLGKSAFDPAIQAYVSERVPFHRRGLAIGFLETAWAGSTLLGIPFIAVLIDRFGWRSPFFALGGFGLLGMFLIARLVPADPGRARSHSPGHGFRMAWKTLLRQRSALGVLGYAFFVSAANDNLFVVYGAWLETSFDLGILALGGVTGGIGFAELAGEMLTAMVADRLGLRRSVIGGLLLSVTSYAALPHLGSGLLPAIIGLFLIFLSFEFTLVTSLSLSTEVLPGYRATMMAGFLATAGLGRIVGALIGGPIWEAGGISGTAMTSASISGVGLLCLLWGTRRGNRSERRPDSPDIS